MKRVKLGVIGVGNMGSGHIRNIVDGKVPEIEITAAADRIPDRVAWAEKMVPGIQTFQEGSDLIKSGACEAILIAVPHYDHPVLAVQGFAEGLHVMCEKPAGVYTKQVREMNEVAEKSGLVFGMMFNQRTNCLYRRMHELVQGGSLGQIRRVNWIITNWFRTQSYYDSGDWRATWDGEGGGVLLNQCPHQLDLLQWICGLPVRVQAFCKEGKWHENIEVEDDVTAYLEFENGATGVFVTTTGDAPGTNRFEVTLDMGKLVCEEDRLVLYRLNEPVGEFSKRAAGGFDTPACERIEVETDGENPQHAGVLNAFAGRILRGTPLIAKGCEGIRGLSLSNAMHLSSWQNRMVELPVEEELFLRELNKKREHSVKKSCQSVVFRTDGSY